MLLKTASRFLLFKVFSEKKIYNISGLEGLIAVKRNDYVNKTFIYDKFLNVFRNVICYSVKEGKQYQDLSSNIFFLLFKYIPILFFIRKKILHKLSS